MIALLLAFLAAPAAAQAPERVRVGLDPRTAPWAYVPGYDYRHEDYRAQPTLGKDQLARLVGLDVDVLRALERRMGVRMDVVPTAWLSLEAGLLAGRYDLILNAWTPTAKTPSGIVASEPYYEWGLLVAARAADPSISTLGDLAGHRIGHVSDPTVLPALHAMGAGLGASLVVVGEPLNRLGYHVGVRAGDKALLQRVQQALQGFAASAEAAELRRKWEDATTPDPWPNAR